MFKEFVATLTFHKIFFNVTNLPRKLVALIFEFFDEIILFIPSARNSLLCNSVSFHLFWLEKLKASLFTQIAKIPK